MVRLQGGGLHLVLRRRNGGHTISVFDRFDDVLTNWCAGSRTSPIYPVNSARPTELSGRRRSWLLFVGPIDPSELADVIDDHSGIFLTFGLYNILFFSHTEKQRSRAKRFALARNTQWEEWSLAGDRLDRAETSTSHHSNDRLAKILPHLNLSQPDALEASCREYRLLIAAAIARASHVCPAMADDIARFSRNFKQTIDSLRDDVTTTQGMLVKANAALSRFTSQTFAGTSPITETECHYWTHSLLGVGIASSALFNVRRFVEAVVCSTCIPDRIDLLKAAEPIGDDLAHCGSEHPVWRRNFLFSEESRGASTAVGVADVLPLITFLSGRDSFRSTPVSLSAPLEVVTSCNARSWTPLTLTHEISHQVIAEILGKLLPCVQNSAELRRVVSSFQSKPTSMFHQLQKYLCTGFLSAFGKEFGASDRGDVFTLDPDLLCRIIVERHPSADEVMTHVFDFLHFYRRDGNRYVRSIWTSWGVIPSIHDRVGAYLLRSLCALHVNNLNRRNGYGTSYAQLLGILEELKGEHSEHPYVPRAIQQLKLNKASLLDDLQRHHALVRFVKTFLDAPQLEEAFRGLSQSYPRALSFGGVRIENPLSFIEEHATDLAAAPKKSLWMLNHLAFARME